MTTDLKAGSLIEFTQHGERVIRQVVDIPPHTGYGHTTVPITAGDKIHCVVWKGDTIEVRKTRLAKAGEFKWRYAGKSKLAPIVDVWANWNVPKKRWA